MIPITGRSAGWYDLLAREWPVDGAMGDAPRGGPLFVRFPLAYVAANIRRYAGLIRQYPAFIRESGLIPRRTFGSRSAPRRLIAEKENAEGFAEIVAAILEKRR
jgi:hypothetical protein